MRSSMGTAAALLTLLLGPATGTYLDGADYFPLAEIHGLVEIRGGARTQSDSHEKEISVMEARLQAEIFSHTKWAELKHKGDLWADGITEQGEYETREMWLFSRPANFLDIKIGRQVLTWGTGDLVFLNDLFPKDWQSYFIGRDTEYLKAPSDAIKAGLFTGLANIDVVYTPEFDSDRYITGEYVSHWNDSLGRLAGRDDQVRDYKPSRWFRDDEVAVRVYRNINRYEVAMYGYWGFWKGPGGQTPSGENAFPGLNVYGGSVRGQIGPGIGNAEVAYYDSVDHSGAAKDLVNNSEMRYLAGYAVEPAKDWNVSIQYYVEQKLDYKEDPDAACSQDRIRHVITAQVTRLLMNQNLELSLAQYVSPSDADGYVRPSLLYKFNDKLIFDTGANVFWGRHWHTMFSQYRKNSNVYAALRYSL